MSVLRYYRCKTITQAGAVAEWALGDYDEEGVGDGGEFLLTLYANPELGVEVRAFTDGLGSLRALLATNVLDWWATAPRPRDAEAVERDLREHGVLEHA